MNKFNKSQLTQNLVANIVGKKVYLKRISDEMMEIVKEMGGFQKTSGNNLVWLIECVDENVRLQVLRKLNQLGFIFSGGTSGYSAGDIFSLVLEKGGLSVKFKEMLAGR